MLNTLNCLKAAFDCIWLHRNFIPWEKHLGSGGPQQVHVPSGSEVLGETCGGGCYCCSTERREVSISLGWLRGLQLSPQQPHFSSPKSQARNVCKLQCLDSLQKENIFTRKEWGNVLVPAIWMSPLEAKRRNMMQYRGQACLNEADPTATQGNSRLSLTSKEAESYPQNAYDHKQ